VLPDYRGSHWAEPMCNRHKTSATLGGRRGICPFAEHFNAIEAGGERLGTSAVLWPSEPSQSPRIAVRGRRPSSALLRLVRFVSAGEWLPFLRRKSRRRSPGARRCT
jgi:hypothetical protein